MIQPDWATELIFKACELKGRKIPKVKWIKRNRFSTRGVTYHEPRFHKGFNITVGLGTDEVGGKQVLLHELTHYLGRPKWHHNKRFWLLLRELLIYFELHTDKYVSREVLYMSKAASYL